MSHERILSLQDLETNFPLRSLYAVQNTFEMATRARAHGREVKFSLFFYRENINKRSLSYCRVVFLFYSNASNLLQLTFVTQPINLHVKCSIKRTKKRRMLDQENGLHFADLVRHHRNEGFF